MLPISAEAPKAFNPVNISSPYTSLYYSVEVPGVFKYIFITSYAPNQVFNNTSDEQYQWLENELKMVGC